MMPDEGRGLNFLYRWKDFECFCKQRERSQQKGDVKTVRQAWTKRVKSRGEWFFVSTLTLSVDFYFSLAVHFYTKSENR